MRIFLNPHCDYGKGLSKWKKIEPQLLAQVGKFEVEEIKSPSTIDSQVEKAIKNGERLFIAAGGDGTVNLLLNSLMNSSGNQGECILGAVGLGSSNDFHKPFKKEKCIKGVPMRINWRSSQLCDVIQLGFKNGRGEFLKHYSLINASIGITAQANALFNSRPPLIEKIQRISVEAAIAASALKTILNYHNIPCTLNIEGSGSFACHLTNLGVIKNPYFAGGLCYDTSIKPDDGTLGINLCAEMGRREAIFTLLRLYRRKFRDFPKTYSWLVTQFSVSCQHRFALETDGELMWAQKVEFKVIPRRVRCCP